MNTIIFSKNRPWQLQQTLLSIAQFMPKIGDTNIISVLVKSDPEYCQAYGKLEIQFPLVRFSYERQGFSCWDFFKQQVKYTADNNLICLMVDDTILIDKPMINEPALLENPLLIQSLRLSPSINWCQPAHSDSLITSKIRMDGWNILPHAAVLGNKGDFAYPFDLSASVYSKQFLQNFIFSLECKSNKVHTPKIPNDIEAVFYTESWILSYASLLFTDTAVAKVLTINRVQNQYQNPIDSNKEVSTDSLLEYFSAGKTLNLEAYRDAKYASQIHISDIILND